jgi:hypothetical protein
LLGSLSGFLEPLRAHADRCLRRGLMRIFLYAVAALLALLGFVFLCLGLFYYLAGAVAPWAAACITGGSVVVVAAMMSAAARLSLGGRARARRERSAVEAGERAAAQLKEAMRDQVLRGADLRAGDLVVAGLVAGLVLGASPELRRRLFRTQGRRRRR